MDIEQIKKLIDLMVDNDLSELDISDGEAKVRLRRGPGETPVVTTATIPAASAQTAVAPNAPAEPTAVEAEDDGLIEVQSPMVGTFYTSAGPDSDPFAVVGEPVAEDAVICIIEAMKVMNEIKSDCSGTVVEICVQDAQPVEFGQVLFRVRPN